MECWVSKKGKKGVWSSFLNFLKIFKNEDFGFKFVEKGQIFKAFFRPGALKTEKKFETNLTVGYVYLEESFDTIFNMGYGGGGVQRPPPPWVMGREIRPWPRGLNP